MQMTQGIALGQFPVSRIFLAGGILDKAKLLRRNYLFHLKATFSPANNRISARSENSTDWKSAFRGKSLQKISQTLGIMLLFSRRSSKIFKILCFRRNLIALSRSDSLFSLENCFARIYHRFKLRFWTLNLKQKSPCAK